MKQLSRNELIKMYFEFFESKKHKVIPSYSIIPENDPTVLFTTAGMHPLVPYLLGSIHPEGKRIVDVQKCMRTSDIDSVGDDSHLTFFEMLGNWSFGDYFKEEMIPWSFEFLTSEKYLGISVDSLAVSVFEGNEYAPQDELSANIWNSCGIRKDHIYYLPKQCNWWELGSGTGPCGPDSEIFYINPNKNKCNDKCTPECNCGYFLEIWNDVFMEYECKEGKYVPLKNKNVDTGMGVERTLTALNNVSSVYDTEEFLIIRKRLEELTGKQYENNKKAFRIIMDHSRTSVFILADDKRLIPSNTGAGYILRRLIRRAIRYIKKLEVNESIFESLVTTIIDLYKSYYPELERNKEIVIKELLEEELKFNKTLTSGEKMFNKYLKNVKDNEIDATSAFKLFDTFGFPLEFTEELAKENNVSVDKVGFYEKFKEHQEKSRTASAGEFKGGLADTSYESTKYHTLAHIMLACLRKMFGDSVVQKGANITPERLRFDFSLDHKLTEEEKNILTTMVNDIIKLDLPVIKEEMTYEEAKQQKAVGSFINKYDTKVFVYTIPNISKEICGGPHVKHTNELGELVIQKEESSSAGVRRIKAVLK